MEDVNKNDIVTEADVRLVITAFYDKVLDDDIIGFIFTDIAKIDLQAHLTVICRYWNDIVFGSKQYHGNVLQVHRDIHTQMPLRAGHFTRWLYLFNQAVDSNFQGYKAELMKQRAEMVAKAITAKLTDTNKKELNLVLSIEEPKNSLKNELK